MNIDLSEKGLVDLDIRSLASTKKEVAVLAIVRQLNASRNSLTKVAGLQPFSTLTHLYLSSNRLTSLTGLPLTIVHLEVQDNQLTTVEAISVLSSLQYLDVSGNRLTTLNGVPSAAPIRSLKASSNALSSLSSLRRVNTNTLRTLSIDNNDIGDAKELRILTEFTNLTTLSLFSNPFAEVYPAYHGAISAKVPSLTMLDGVQIKSPSNARERERERPTQRTTPTHQRPATPTQSRSCIKKKSTPGGGGGGGSTRTTPTTNRTPGSTYFDAKSTDLSFRNAVSPQSHTDTQLPHQQPYDQERVRELLQSARQLPMPFQNHYPGGQNSHSDHPPPGVEEHEAVHEQQQQQQHQPPVRSNAAPPATTSLDNPPSVSLTERQLQIQVGELQRLLESCQMKVSSLERDVARKNDELSNARNIIQEQRTELSNNRKSMRETDDKYTQLKEKADKLTREFKYNRQTIVTLRGQLHDKNTSSSKDVSGISSNSRSISYPERRFHGGGNTMSFNSMLQGGGNVSRARRPAHEAKKPIRSMSQNAPQTRGREAAITNSIQKRLDLDPDIIHDQRSRSSPPVSHTSPVRSSTSPSHHKVLSHVSPPKTNIRHPAY